MAQHSLPQGREFLRLGELREKRQLSFLLGQGPVFIVEFFVFRKTEL